MKALVLFSGGQDSTTCLAWALKQYDHVETIGFNYGQRHAIEMACREPIMAELTPVTDYVVYLNGFGRISESALTTESAFAIEASGYPSTFIPARNLMFLSAAGAYAYRRGIDVLVGGMCETDYSGYPDCRRATLDAMQSALSLGMDKPMTIETPLMWLNKAQTWQMAQDLGILELVRTKTHTCYAGDRAHLHKWGYGCGKCPACKLRANGYALFRRPAST